MLSSRAPTEMAPISTADETQVHRGARGLIFSPKELEVLADGVMETGGPFWNRIMALHGPAGTRSKTLRHRRAYHLWFAAAQLYMALADANQPLPHWLDMVGPDRLMAPEHLINGGAPGQLKPEGSTNISSGRSARESWTPHEDLALVDGIRRVCGPWWARIISLYGIAGTKGTDLAGRSETELAARARYLWNRAVAEGQPLNGLEFVAPKGFTASGFPTSRGWTDEQDRLMLRELEELQAPNYNAIIARHGPEGSITTTLASKSYQQLRSRALKLYDFCTRERRPMPKGLQYVRR